MLKHTARSKWLIYLSSKKIATSWLLIFGFFLLYFPSYFHVANTLWHNENQAHGPLILLVVAYLFWKDREYLFVNNYPGVFGTLIGWLFFILGLFTYIIGRSQDVAILDLGSQIPVLIGLLLLVKGLNVLKKFWFPLFFIIFMLPIPGSLLDAVTLPMKIAVSYVAEHVLYFFNYPIARSGVIIQIGQYQLLVADACAGMHTLISLEALGLLYLNIVKHDSFLRNIVLAALIIPISFTANVIRVIVLTLITYYLGDEVGQGFVHGFAGLLLFVVALSLIISVDSLLQYLSKNTKRTEISTKKVKFSP
ncbi:exosortase B [Methylobacillus methanolivorans]|uniref:Exosortase B n=1 Tax=Methylobacillus methanolivorans TaxID=1848927 RepID=A0ABW8GHU9_9PROT